MNEIKNQPEALRLAHLLELDKWPDAATELRRQHARISKLEAARIAYASEFKPDADGDPDVGNIHANIRALKAQLAATQAAVDMGIPTSASATVSDEQIKAVFLANGFTIKEGMTDLKPYVYQAARALLNTNTMVLMGYMHPGNFGGLQRSRWKTGKPCALRLNGWTGEPRQVAVYAKQADVDAALAAQAQYSDTSKPVDAVLQMVRDQEAKKNVCIAEGICPTCEGEGEWTCEDCNGSGRYSTKT